MAIQKKYEFFKSKNKCKSLKVGKNVIICVVLYVVFPSIESYGQNDYSPYNLFLTIDQVLNVSEKVVKGKKREFYNVISCFPIGYPTSRNVVGSSFGLRFHPIKHRNKFHNGVDISGEYGQVVKSTGDGVVVGCGYDGERGNYVRILHCDSRFETVYLHLSQISVFLHEQVVLGEVVGSMGNSGSSTGVHLHYSIKFNGEYVDPERFISIW